MKKKDNQNNTNINNNLINFLKNTNLSTLINIFLIIFFLVIISVIFFKIVMIFIVPLLLAVTFTTLFYPLYKLLFKLFRKQKTVTALVFCILIIIIILIPLYFIGHLVFLQAQDFWESSNVYVREIISQGDKGPIGKIQQSKIMQIISLNDIDLIKILEDFFTAVGKQLPKITKNVSSGILGIIANIFFTFYAMFYFFRDGDVIIKRLRYLSPLRDEYEEKLIKRFSSISRATVKGTVIIGILQGVAGTITFIIFGVKGWILWGVLMVILSIIPIVGSFIVMIPVAVFKIATGHIWQGIIIIFVALVINYAIDYLLRPILVGHESKMHDLLIFISTIGGIVVFGVMGFIIGPMIAMIFITLLDIYGTEFKGMLHYVDRK